MLVLWHCCCRKAALELVSLCCIGRFVQILFEPCVVGVAAPPPADASTADMSLGASLAHASRMDCY